MSLDTKELENKINELMEMKEQLDRKVEEINNIELEYIFDIEKE